MYLYCSVRRDGERARQDVASFIGHGYGDKPGAMLDRIAPAGTPEEYRRPAPTVRRRRRPSLHHLTGGDGGHPGDRAARGRGGPPSPVPAGRAGRGLRVVAIPSGLSEHGRRHSHAPQLQEARKTFGTELAAHARLLESTEGNERERRVAPVHGQAAGSYPPGDFEPRVPGLRTRRLRPDRTATRWPGAPGRRLPRRR